MSAERASGDDVALQLGSRHRCVLEQGCAALVPGGPYLLAWLLLLGVVPREIRF